MVADWSLESTRILGAISMEHVPLSIKDRLSEMVQSVKECVNSSKVCERNAD
jgi:hypothetical protein